MIDVCYDNIIITAFFSLSLSSQPSVTVKELYENFSLTVFLQCKLVCMASLKTFREFECQLGICLCLPSLNPTPSPLCYTTLTGNFIWHTNWKNFKDANAQGKKVFTAFLKSPRNTNINQYFEKEFYEAETKAKSCGKLKSLCFFGIYMPEIFFFFFWWLGERGRG